MPQAWQPARNIGIFLICLHSDVPRWPVICFRPVEFDSGGLGCLDDAAGVTEISITREGKNLVIIYETKLGQEPPNIRGKAEALGYANRGSVQGEMQIK